MIRILVLFLVVFLLALGGVWLADHPGTVTVRWLDVEVETTFAIALAAVALLVGLILILNQLLGSIFRGARGVSRFLSRRKEQRSRKLLAQGLLALAAGDPGTARRAAVDMAEDRDDVPLIRFLKAEAAERLGAKDEAWDTYQAMLEDPATELLGLLGLSALAKEAGDRAGARDFARRAFRRDGANRRAFRAHFKLLLEDRDWDAARTAVEHALRHRALPEARARSMTAELFAAEAREKSQAGLRPAALSLAQKGLGLDETCLPAALFAAEVLAETGKRGRAGSVIQAMWARAPHPRLGEIFAGLVPSETPAERQQRIAGLVSVNRDHPESRLLMARHAIEAGAFADAREALAALAAGPAAPSRAALMMAHLERADGQDPAAVEGWLLAAAEAPRDGLWACRACGHEPAGWSALCPNCERFDTLSWQVAAPPSVLAAPGPGLPGPDDATTAGIAAAAMAQIDPDPTPPRIDPPSTPDTQAPEPEIYVPPPPPDDPGPEPRSDSREGWV